MVSTALRTPIRRSCRPNAVRDGTVVVGTKTRSRHKACGAQLSAISVWDVEKEVEFMAVYSLYTKLKGF